MYVCMASSSARVCASVVSVCVCVCVCVTCMVHGLHLGRTCAFCITMYLSLVGMPFHLQYTYMYFALLAYPFVQIDNICMYMYVYYYVYALLYNFMHSYLCMQPLVC